MELADLGFECKYRFDLNTTTKITYVSFPSGFKVQKSSDKLVSSIILEKGEVDGSSLRTDLVLYYKTLGMNKPRMLL